MLVVLGIMVLIHELGHFVVAKLCGVRVEVFSVGFGRRLFGWKRGDTDYRVSLLPLGGYVKMSGEQPDEVTTGDPGEFTTHPRWQRILIALAGPTANFLLAIVLMTGFYMMHNEVAAFRSQPARIDFVTAGTAAATAGLKPGDLITEFDHVQNPNWQQISIHSVLNLGHSVAMTVDRGGKTVSTSLAMPSPRDSDDFTLGSIGLIPQMQPGPLRVNQVEENLPAGKAGLKSDDLILSIDGLKLHSVESTLAFLQENGTKSVHLDVLRGSQKMEISLTPVKAEEGDGQKLYRMGFSAYPPPFKVEQLALLPAARQSMHFNIKNSSLILDVLHRMVTHKLAVRTLTGPIGIARQTGLAVEQPGWQPIIGLTAIISLNLGIVNLLPIPIMDGGVIAFLLIEGVMRRDLNQELKERIYQAAFVALVLFFVFIIVNDISKLPLFYKGLKP